MNFEQIVTLSSLLISAVAIIVPHISIRYQIRYKLKKDHALRVREERDLCAEFLGYCKKAYALGLNDEELLHFGELYAKLHLIRDAELKSALISFCDAVVTKSEVSSEEFGKCLRLFEKHFKESLC